MADMDGWEEAPMAGLTVEWSSQSRGVTRHKRGIVIYDGKTFDSIQRAPETEGWLSPDEREAFRQCSRSQDKTGYERSCNTGILVKVQRRGRRGWLNPHYYSPRPDDLDVVG